MTDWYVWAGGETVGPLSEADVRARAYSAGTYVCPVGDQNWHRIEEFAVLGAAPATAPPIVPIEGRPRPPDWRRRVFVVHGRAIRLDDALEKVLGLLRNKIYHFDQHYWVKASDVNLVRYVVNESHRAPFLATIEAMVATKIGISQYYAPPPGSEIEADLVRARDEWAQGKRRTAWARIVNFVAAQKLEEHGAPWNGETFTSEKEALAWAGERHAAFLAEFARLFGVPARTHPELLESLEALRAEVNPPSDGSPHPPRWREWEWTEIFRDAVGRRGGDVDAALAGLEEIRRIHEAGGDFDTVASNALYAAWTIREFRARYGYDPVYGRDYDFDFVNYHEPFDHLAAHAHSDVYIPDFPLEATLLEATPAAEAPGWLARLLGLFRRAESEASPPAWTLRRTAEALRAADGWIARFDDHHPYTRERLALLDALVRDGLLGTHVLTGGIQGKEHIPLEEQSCGADLVHKAVLEGTPLDNEAYRAIRHMSHLQDLHIATDPTALQFSKLIGSKFSKYEMAQRLPDVETAEDVVSLADRAGWSARVSRYEDDLAGIQPRITRYLVRLSYVPAADLLRYRPDEGVWAKVLRLLTLGRVDVGAARIAAAHPEVVRRIVVALAPLQERKETKLNVASALQYVRPRYPMDYFFYLWGSPFLTTRRVNDDDDALDLSVMCARIGKGGGHPGAASTKIDEAEDFVNADLGRVFRRLHDPDDALYGAAPPPARTFLLFVDYLCRRIERKMGGRFVGIERLGRVDETGAGAEVDVSRLVEQEGSQEAAAA